MSATQISTETQSPINVLVLDSRKSPETDFKSIAKSIVLSAALESNSIEIDLVSEPNEALSKIEENPLDLLIVNGDMLYGGEILAFAREQYSLRCLMGYW